MPHGQEGVYFRHGIETGSIPARELHWSQAMSVTHFRSADRPAPAVLPAKVTLQTLEEKKARGKPIVALTAYDYATARLVDEAGVDIILVGDSLAMVVLGYDTTLPVTLEEMLLHTRAARRAVRRAMLVADMPFGSYHASVEEGVRNAARFLKEAGAEAVKIEGGRVELVDRLSNAGIPVMAHLGLTPQSVHKMGGYRVQGKTIAEFRRLLDDALALESAGAFSLVLEGVPREVAQRITAALKIPVIGIGAGPDCDGQILVLHDLLNLTFSPAPKFVRRYGDAAALIADAVEGYRNDVEQHSFPNNEESYHLTKDALEVLEAEELKLSRKAW